MRLSYRSLFKIQTRHTFYQEAVSAADFRVRPTATTQTLLDQRGLVFRAESGRFGIYAEVVPGSEPARLSRAIDPENMVFGFELEAINPYLINISRLGHYRPGRELFYFDNLRHDQVGSELYLGDSVAGQRLGAPLALQSSTIVDYSFTNPVASAQLTLVDRFGNQLDSQLVSAPAGQGLLSSFRYDLADIPGVGPGRYRLQDNLGGDQQFYYDPQLFGGNVFGVIELFNRTDQLTPDSTNRVPNAYRFLDGDQVIVTGDFIFQLERRSTRWRYIVDKKYANNGISLAQLGVTGPVAFSRDDTPTQAVFTAQDPLPLGEVQQVVTLAHNGSQIRNLPNPTARSPVLGLAGIGNQFSDIYVSV